MKIETEYGTLYLTPEEYIQLMAETERLKNVGLSESNKGRPIIPDISNMGDHEKGYLLGIVEEATPEQHKEKSDADKTGNKPVEGNCEGAKESNQAEGSHEEVNEESKPEEYTLEECLRAFEEDCIKGGSTSKSATIYKNAIKKTLLDIGKIAREITKEDIFRELGGDHAISRRYVYNKFCEFMLKTYCVELPKFSIAEYKASDFYMAESFGEALTKQEIIRMYKKFEGDPRKELMFELLIVTGLGAYGITQIKRCDAEKYVARLHRFEENYIFGRTIVGSPCMNKYLSKRNDNNAYLFAGLNKKTGSISGPDWWTYPNNVGDGSLDSSRIADAMNRAARRTKIKDNSRIMKKIMETSRKWREENGYLEEA